MRTMLFGCLVSGVFCLTFCASVSSDETGHFLNRHTDDTLRNLPADITRLTLRGSHGYGTDVVTDKGIEELHRYKNLRSLEAGALGLTDKSLASIGQLVHLEELSLDSNAITGNGLHHLLNLTNLKKLVLHFNPLGEGWSKVVSKLESLEELGVVIYQRPVTDEELVDLSKLTKLRRLDLHDKANGVTDAGLDALSLLTELKSVSLSEAEVTSRGLERLASLQNLQVLHLRNLRGVSSGSFGWLPKLTQLRDLEIVGTALNNEDMSSINDLATLESILIWNVSRGYETLRIERLGNFPSLRMFRTNEILMPEAIIDLSKARKLEYLGDDLTEINDEGLGQVAELPNLQTLYLSGDHLTNKSLEVLASMKSLRFLCISDDVKITAEQLHSLGESSLPKCKIVARHGNVVYYEPAIGQSPQ